MVGHLCGLRFHVAAQPVQRHAAAQPIYQRQHFCQRRRVFRTVDLLAEHGQSLLFGDALDVIYLVPGQDAHCSQRAGHISAQVLFAVPRRAVDGHTRVCDMEQGLVPVDHHGPVAKLLHPQPGVGGFAGATFSCEQIRLSIHRHHGTMHQQAGIYRIGMPRQNH